MICPDCKGMKKVELPPTSEKIKCPTCKGTGEMEEPIIPIKTTKRLKVKIGKSKHLKPLED